MKAFTFRLEQALRWRQTQVGLQKSRVAGAAGRVAEIEAILKPLKAGLSGAAADIIHESSGGALGSYASFRERSRARIRDCEAQAAVAQRTLSLEMNRLIEANQKLRLLENLRRTHRGRWHREFDHELAAFADEAFLCRIQSKT
jgi:hypothetical protein